MLGALTLLFVCQLAGEVLVKSLGLPVPGPVAGMLLLLAGLVVRGREPPALTAAGDGLLGHLSLLFVPAGVGVMVHGGLIGRDGVAISVALVASTLIAIAVTGWAMARLSRAAEPTSTDKTP